MPDAKTPQKVSSAELFARLDALGTSVAELRQLAKLQLSPEPVYVYKPRASGDGNALKLDLRLSPTFNAKGFVHDVTGGLYVEVVGQTGKGEDGFARFGWQEESRLVAKLGIPDISALLVGIRSVRYLGKPVPAGVRAKADEQGTTVSLFHKFGTETTAIDYKFVADGSYLRVSKSKEWNRSIRLTLVEELQIETYLQSALRAFQLVGQR